jgi:hypothetical protein
MHSASISSTAWALMRGLVCSISNSYLLHKSEGPILQSIFLNCGALKAQDTAGPPVHKLNDAKG